jgi:hypothetical protein
MSGTSTDFGITQYNITASSWSQSVHKLLTEVFLTKLISNM